VRTLLRSCIPKALYPACQTTQSVNACTEWLGLLRQSVRHTTPHNSEKGEKKRRKDEEKKAQSCGVSNNTDTTPGLIHPQRHEEAVPGEERAALRSHSTR